MMGGQFSVEIVRSFQLIATNPKWLVKIFGGLFGLSREYVKNNVGIPIQLDSTKSIEKLKLDYTPLEQTVKDMIEQMASFQSTTTNSK